MQAFQFDKINISINGYETFLFQQIFLTCPETCHSNFSNGMIVKLHFR